MTITVSGNAQATAIYIVDPENPPPPPPPPVSTYALVLDSQSFDSASATHEGTITFNATPYSSLPASLTVAAGSYTLTFTAPNASTHFLYWQFSGNIASMTEQGETMTVMVFGDATATAVFLVAQTPPVIPPQDGEWNSLFLDNRPDKGSLVPYSMWSQMNSHDVTHSRTGNLKQVNVLITPISSPQIQIANIVNLTLYMRPTPPDSVKSIETTIGFRYNGANYTIATCTFSPIANTLIYTASMNVANLDFGFGKQIIPAGSYITITKTVTFVEDNGFSFVYIGADTPSRLDLY